VPSDTIEKCVKNGVKMPKTTQELQNIEDMINKLEQCRNTLEQCTNTTYELIQKLENQIPEQYRVKKQGRF